MFLPTFVANPFCLCGEGAIYLCISAFLGQFKRPSDVIHVFFPSSPNPTANHESSGQGENTDN